MLTQTCPIQNGLEAIEWIRVPKTNKFIFRECAYETTDVVSIFFGYISIIMWLFAQFPQLYKNMVNGSAESLSILFLSNWLLGDLCNLLGCLLTNQLPFQTYLAMYFVFIDTSLFVQAFWYKYAKKRESIEEVVVDETTPLIRSGSATSLCIILLGIMSSRSSDNHFIITTTIPQSEYYELGRILAWTCTALYLSSRIPQIYLNFKRRSCHGLAIAMFMCALFGNITYAASIVIKSQDHDYLLGALPYLLGTVGTVLFDITIFIQWLVYRRVIE